MYGRALPSPGVRETGWRMFHRTPATRACIWVVALGFATAGCTPHRKQAAARPSPRPSKKNTMAPRLAPCGPGHADALPRHLTSVVMATSKIGWGTEAAFAGCSNGPWTVLRTVDAGATWRDVTPPTTLGTGFDPAFFGTGRAWAVASVGGRRVVGMRT